MDDVGSAGCMLTQSLPVSDVPGLTLGGSSVQVKFWPGIAFASAKSQVMVAPELHIAKLQLLYECTPVCAFTA